MAVDVRLERNDPPRAYRAGPATEVVIRDCGRLLLDADEQITFVTADGAEHDVARKDWGFYATASLNARLPEHRLHGALVRNDGGRYYIFLMEEGKRAAFETYLRDERQTVVAWLDDTATLDRIERTASDGPSVRLEPDAWLAEVLERPVFRVTLGGLEPLATHARLHRGSFYYAKLPTDDVSSATALTRSGMVTVDVNVTLTRDARLPVRPATRVPDVDIHDVRPAEAAAVAAIAGRSFRYSRFHLDPAFPKEVADRVKREWIANAARGQRGDSLLVACDGEKPVGFLAVLTARSEGIPCAVIDLIAVDPDAQGRGIGRALVDAFVSRYGATHPLLRVGTQAANTRSLVLYQFAGFVVTSTQYVLHLHS
jgi:ribosomal protein S18 acetylase RimI-like enzyme